MQRVHLVNPGTVSKHHTSTVTPKPVMLRTPPRVYMKSTSPKNPMHNTCRTFSVYGVNANPMKSGTTAGARVIVSRRNTSKFTYAGL